ncbi:MAG: transporter substrate-binding domain-containing protein [Desulfobacter sp.]|nr:transporter substrate-binding domain-containing protein [Desulfobacter sp.]
MPDPFFFHESIFGLKNLEDLKGFNIGILDQDYAVEFVTRELPDAAIKKYGSHKALFDGVAKGEVRVFICDTPTALYFLEKLNLLSSFRYHLASPLYRKPFYSAVKEGNDALVAQINKGLELISADERAAIERKWMGPSENRETDVLVVAVAQSFPPFSMLNAENRPSGLLIDLWERWSVTTGNSLIFRFYDRNNAVNALKDGIVDIVSFLPPRQTTKGWTQASSAFYRLSWYLYHHKNRSNRPLAKGQTQRTLGAVTGSRAYEWLASSRRNIRVAGFETTRQMILAAAEGKIDGFLALPQEMAVLPDRLGYPEAFVQSDNPLFRQQMGGIVRNLNPDLIQRIDQGFNAIGQAERIQIESRWIRDKKARVFNPVNDQILLTRDEQQWLSAHQDLSRSIRLGVDPQWPPFEFIGDNFAYKGMVSDYVNLLNERLALNMVVAEQIPGGMDRTKTVFSRVDVVPSAISFESEKVGMLRTQAYLEFPWVIINKQQAPLIGGIRDFHGKTLAVIQRYAVKDLLGKEHPEIRILEVKTTRQGLAAVLSGQADGYLENLAVAGYQIQAQNHSSLKVAAATDLPGTGLVFSVRKDWQPLAGILDKAIASISDQEHDRIRQKWFSVRFEHKVDEGAHSHFPGYTAGTGLCMFAICFRQFQRPAL